jgi:hypothetical protein
MRVPADLMRSRCKTALKTARIYRRNRFFQINSLFFLNDHYFGYPENLRFRKLKWDPLFFPKTREKLVFQRLLMDMSG